MSHLQNKLALESDDYAVITVKRGDKKVCYVISLPRGIYKCSMSMPGFSGAHRMADQLKNAMIKP